MSNFSQMIAYKTLNLLNERKALVYPEGTAFYLWPLADRMVIVFDADEINQARVDDDFAHHLSSRLSGRRIVRTNSRGVFLQVAYNVPPALMDLNESPLDLSHQPTPLHIPVGMTARGELWLDLVEADSILLGGSRGMGKTAILHGWIQSLLRGGQAEVRAWDGKAGSEFGRYADRPQFQLLSDLDASLRDLLIETSRRRVLLTRSGHPNAAVYNQQGGERMKPIALVVDEAALVKERARPLLAELVERCRDTGVHPIFGTNNPQQSQLIVKSNLVTRISLAVPNLSASVMVLGMSGAEKLPRQHGRGLVERNARMVEFQAFRVTYPQPTAEAVARVVEAQEEAEAPAIEERERIVELSEQGKSNSAIVRELYRISGGDTFLRRLDEVKAVLAAKKVTTTTTSMPVNTPGSALAGA